MADLIKELTNKDGIYKTRSRHIPFLFKSSPSISFYLRIFYLIVVSGIKSKRSKYNNYQWYKDSQITMKMLENVGVRFNIEGINNISSSNGPCVFVANHMSTLETFVLPSLILPYKNVTFIIKDSLLNYPFFGKILRSSDPIVVGRKNPRIDLLTVLEKGINTLKNNRSIVVFPQGERSVFFEPDRFNSIGIKLSKRADVPIIPIALKTDAWKIGKYLKDIGKIDNSKIVYFSFGATLQVKGKGAEEHNAIINYINSKLKEWT